MRYLPVDERVMRAISAALAGITQAAGYNTTVRHVRRVQDLVELSPDPPEIHLAAGEGTTDRRGTEDNWTEMQLSVLFYIRPLTQGTDTEYRFFKADIIRALAQPIMDNASVPYGGQPYEVYIHTDFTERPLYFEGGTGTSNKDVAGELQYRIQYSWCRTDPRVWGADDRLVPE